MSQSFNYSIGTYLNFQEGDTYLDCNCRVLTIGDFYSNSESMDFRTIADDVIHITRYGKSDTEYIHRRDYVEVFV